jgi:hypothetical protein
MVGAFPIEFVEAELFGTVGVLLVLEVRNQDGKEMTLSALIAWDRTNEF